MYERITSALDAEFGEAFLALAAANVDKLTASGRRDFISEYSCISSFIHWMTPFTR